jgi:Flp pilus assembly protein TadG
MSFLRCVYRLRHFWRDERANSLMLMGFALPFVIGAAGLGVHTMQLSLVKRQLQREADSAALAGGYSLFQGQGNTAASAQANAALTQNNLVPGASPTITPTGTFVIGGITYTATMYVRLVSTQATPLMALFGRSTSTITAEARAAIVPDGPLCFRALENGNTTGITFAGNTNIDLGCGAGTNSKHATKAIDHNGQPTVSASPLVAMGGIASGNYANGTVLMPNHAEVTDPFAGNNFNPDVDANGQVNGLPCRTGNTWNVIDVPSGQSAAGVPGCYGTINVQGTLTLQGGVYFLADGSNNAGLQVGAQGHLRCPDGCTFVLTSTTPNNANSFATMNINGGAEVDISPWESGIYSEITIYRDNRASASNQCCTINGNANSELSGAFYFPNDTLTFNGTAGMTLDCFQMVALRLAFSGNAAITNTCPRNPEWFVESVRLIS